MATIVLKESFLLEGQQGQEVSVIKCDNWVKHYSLDAIETIVSGKTVIVPVNNITAIIE